jgi:hypothetical protein
VVSKGKKTFRELKNDNQYQDQLVAAITCSTDGRNRMA